LPNRRAAHEQEEDKYLTDTDAISCLNQLVWQLIGFISNHRLDITRTTSDKFDSVLKDDKSNVTKVSLYKETEQTISVRPNTQFCVWLSQPWTLLYV